ncbi:MAG: hypothetical protein IT372_33920 [Polyangiaceae bacterium]|nr:hypothetical protein [Polyangiaceae bacterium]
MREALSRTIAELEGERAGLEAKVEARTAELQRALDDLKRAQAALVHGERLALLGELVSNVAHEIYNPLNAIAGAAEPLERVAGELRAMLAACREAEADLPPERRRALTRLRGELDVDASLEDLAGIAVVVRRAVDRSGRIVTNLKDFARVPGEPLPADLHAGLDETLLLRGPRLRRAGVEILRSYGDLPPVTCRSGEINQVFMNLLVNAIQALEAPDPRGSGSTPLPGAPARSAERREIRIETWIDGGAAAVAIADSGPGVPPEIAGRIFDPFFTTKPRGQGTGLGLSISTEIVRRHGGSLTLEPAPAGARFVCRLPI